MRKYRSRREDENPDPADRDVHPEHAVGIPLFPFFLLNIIRAAGKRLFGHGAEPDRRQNHLIFGKTDVQVAESGR